MCLSFCIAASVSITLTSTAAKIIFDFQFLNKMPLKNCSWAFLNFSFPHPEGGSESFQYFRGCIFFNLSHYQNGSCFLWKIIAFDSKDPFTILWQKRRFIIFNHTLFFKNHPFKIFRDSKIRVYQQYFFRRHTSCPNKLLMYINMFYIWIKLVDLKWNT